MEPHPVGKIHLDHPGIESSKYDRNHLSVLSVSRLKYLKLAIFFWVNRNRDLGTVPGYLFCENADEKDRTSIKRYDTLMFVYQQLEALLRSQAT